MRSLILKKKIKIQQKYDQINKIQTKATLLLMISGNEFMGYYVCREIIKIIGPWTKMEYSIMVHIDYGEFDPKLVIHCIKILLRQCKFIHDFINNNGIKFQMF